MEKIKLRFPQYKIVLSFFSPSGYEIRKEYPLVDAIVYLPLDTPSNAKKFLALTHPDLAIFVKYEFWRNFLRQLHLKQTKTLLVSGIFRAEQAFFKTHLNWYRNQLYYFTHFFVQDKNSENLLQNIGFDNVTVSGDTRFDRVFELAQSPKEIPFFKEFCENSTVLIAGSSWPQDEELLIKYINEATGAVQKFIIAPHNIHIPDIKRLVEKIQKKTVLNSELNAENVTSASVIIIDSIGILNAAYSYASMAYVGGGFGVGIHNVLEPATYGIPIIIGPNYQKFKEAVDLVNAGACHPVKSYEELYNVLQNWGQNKELVLAKGAVSKEYVQKHTGATQKILAYIQDVL